MNEVWNMPPQVLYLCPEHPDQVLFREYLGVMKMFIAEAPATCPRCRKAYYKWECQTNQNADSD
jgi:hypothetical protein